MVYGTYNYIVTGAYKPTYNWGAPHCVISAGEEKEGKAFDMRKNTCTER